MGLYSTIDEKIKMYQQCVLLSSIPTTLPVSPKIAVVVRGVDTGSGILHGYNGSGTVYSHCFIEALRCLFNNKNLGSGDKAQ